MLLAHSNHSHQKPHETVKPSPIQKNHQEINESEGKIEEKIEPSTMTIQVQSSASNPSSMLPGLGEFMFVMIIITPIILKSIKTKMQY